MWVEMSQISAFSHTCSEANPRFSSSWMHHFFVPTGLHFKGLTNSKHMFSHKSPHPAVEQRQAVISQHGPGRIVSTLASFIELTVSLISRSQNMQTPTNIKSHWFYLPDWWNPLTPPLPSRYHSNSGSMRNMGSTQKCELGLKTQFSPGSRNLLETSPKGPNLYTFRWSTDKVAASS